MMIGGLVRMRRRCQRCDCQSNKDGQRWRNSVSGKSPLRTVSRQREPLTNCDPEFFCIVKEGGSRMLVDDLYLFTRSSVVDTVNKLQGDDYRDREWVGARRFPLERGWKPREKKQPHAARLSLRLGWAAVRKQTKHRE